MSVKTYLTRIYNKINFNIIIPSLLLLQRHGCDIARTSIKALLFPPPPLPKFCHVTVLIIPAEK